ncbi:flavin reductase family protein [Actinomadura madurae]|uniref:flavin reductase family protein n=1 Tax=Actinomadura madurae TaxID=1993 RepID=UPI0020271FBB|nr:flavin reductase family protein [Actinomadura madurae]URN02167.1 flavin reductase family protein [Actinomadura madurae]
MHGSPNGSSGPSAARVDAAAFRSVLSRFATGVVAVTAVDPASGRPTGLAVNSFTSVSLDPPLVAFCVAHTSRTWPRLRTAGRLCVNILADSQLDVTERLAFGNGDEKFTGIGWSHTPGGAPLISDALAWIECSVEQEHPAGDHMIVVSRVHDLAEHHDAPPLIFYNRTYGTFA